VADWASGVWEALAVTLAEPLRRSFDEHLTEHRCGTGDPRSPFYIGGFGNCTTAMDLFRLLPDADRVLLG
jgi:hypothetical protein